MNKIERQLPCRVYNSDALTSIYKASQLLLLFAVCATTLQTPPATLKATSTDMADFFALINDTFPGRMTLEELSTVAEDRDAFDAFVMSLESELSQLKIEEGRRHRRATGSGSGSGSATGSGSGTSSTTAPASTVSATNQVTTSVDSTSSTTTSAYSTTSILTNASSTTTSATGAPAQSTGSPTVGVDSYSPSVAPTSLELSLSSLPTTPSQSTIVTSQTTTSATLTSPTAVPTTHVGHPTTVATTVVDSTFTVSTSLPSSTSTVAVEVGGFAITYNLGQIDLNSMNDTEIHEAKESIEDAYLEANPSISSEDIAYIRFYFATSRRRAVGDLVVEIVLKATVIPEIATASVSALPALNITVAGVPSTTAETSVGSVELITTTQAPFLPPNEESSGADAAVVAVSITVSLIAMIGIGFVLKVYYKKKSQSGVEKITVQSLGSPPGPNISTV